MQEATVQVDSVSRICRGAVTGFAEDGTVLVELWDREPGVATCDMLDVGERSLVLQPGDAVVCWLPSGDAERGVVLGRVVGTRRPANPAVPDNLVMEAKHGLTLKCGDGSITIREDGKILIKGKDLVSHAKRVNRIRGGSVQIN